MTLDHFIHSLQSSATLRDSRSTFNAFIHNATSDRHVLGVVLSGSQAREGMATDISDYDVYTVVDDWAPEELLQLSGFRSAHLDLVVFRLEEFRGYALPKHEAAWDAYAFVGARVLLDRTDGLIGELVAWKSALTAKGAHQRVTDHLDAYTNSVYRSLKNHRDGRLMAARLDATESIPHLLTVLFALHRRIRPYNKYLEWELKVRPLPEESVPERMLLDCLQRIQTDADPAAQRALFISIERTAREQGHSPMLDAWGEDLQFLRAAPS